jgi:peptide/nickel transport system substrate-binding protein
MIRILNKLKNFFSDLKQFVKRTWVDFKSGRRQTELDKKLVFSLAKSRWPTLKQLKYVGKYLSRAERLTVCGCLTIILLSSLFLAIRFYKTHLEVIPAAGGDYIEGVVGLIKYINPLYSTFSDVDNDIASLVFSSLFRRGEAAQLINDLAQGYSISPDGKSYTIKVRTDASWHNGGHLTVDDIAFTFAAIKNPQYKSPLRTSFTGVEMEKIDEQTIKFNLAEPYAAFLDLLTFGILPLESWQQIEPAAASLAELNLKPLGSGRYKFKSLVKDKAGNIRTYNLVRNANYYRQPAYINNLTFKLFGNLAELISALNNNSINGLSYLPEQVKNEVVAQDSLNFHHLNLPKLSAVFFNSKAEPALADKKVRQALAHAIDRAQIVSQTMAGNARVIDSPVFPGSFAYNPGIKKYQYDVATSSRLLDEAGWKVVELKSEDIAKAEEEVKAKDEAVKKQAQANLNMGAGKWLFKNNNYLTIKLTTVDGPEYSQAARLIANFWRAVNVKTEVDLLPASQVQGDVIRLRNFAALFYGEIIGADPDLFAFWHSSQIGQAGLNIADYSNKEVDKLLEEGRLTSDLKVRQEKYKKFQEILAEDEPAIFLYSPYYTYVQSKNIRGFNIKNIILPSDRFADVEKWYMKTGKKIAW